jgi:hypothetical protein
MQRHFGARDVIDFLRILQRERDEVVRERHFDQLRGTNYE